MLSNDIYLLSLLKEFHNYYIFQLVHFQLSFLRSQSSLFVLGFNILAYINCLLACMKFFLIINVHFFHCLGWHICSICGKGSHYKCYTCTYSLCKGCTKRADFVSVRENKGLCGMCKRTIMLVENCAQGDKVLVVC